MYYCNSINIRILKDPEKSLKDEELEDYFYLNREWHDFEINPINEVDNVILARFSYLPFHDIYLEPKENIKSIAKKMKIVPKSNFVWEEDKEFIEELNNGLLEVVKAKEKPYTLHFSVGYKRYDESIEDVPAFIAKADEGLYHIKNARPKFKDIL